MKVMTVDAKKLGISDFKVTCSLGTQTKVAMFQQKIAKLQLDAQTELAALTRDARLVDTLKHDKSEDQRTMQRLADKYDMNLGPFDPEMWDVYKNGIGTAIDMKVEMLANPASAQLLLKRAKISFDFIEDLAGITTKRGKEKLENNDDLTLDDLDEVTSQIVNTVMGTEDAKPTEDDRKSKS